MSVKITLNRVLSVREGSGVQVPMAVVKQGLARMHGTTSQTGARGRRARGCAQATAHGILAASMLAERQVRRHWQEQ